MKINDVTLAELSDLSYIDLPEKFQNRLELIKKLEAEGDFKKAEKYKVTLSDFCSEVSMDPGKYIRGYKSNTTDKKMIAMMEIINEYKDKKYKEIVMVGYENNNSNNSENNGNKKDGFVGYAFETPSKEVIVASRGSELGNGLKSWEDWLDNFSIAACLETNQQKEALNFVNRCTKGYEKIYMTGHSKGGNNVLYALLNMEKELREKVVNCTTFNAPGFNNTFLNTYKSIIEKLNENGIVLEYRQRDDYVSVLMNNIGKAIFISPDKDGFVENHFIYTMKIEDGKFVIDENQKPGIVSKYINMLVNQILNKFDDSQLGSIWNAIQVWVHKEDGVTSIKNLIAKLQNVKSKFKIMAVTLLKSISKFIYTGIESLIEKINPKNLMNTPSITLNAMFIFKAIPIVETIKSGIGFMGNFFEKGARALLKSIKNVDLVKIDNLMGISLAVNPLPKLNKVITKEYFLVNTAELEIAHKAYKRELEKVEVNIKEVEQCLTTLTEEGWNGKASTAFYEVVMTTMIKDMNSLKKGMNKAISMLNNAIIRCNELSREEKRLLECFN